MTRSDRVKLITDISESLGRMGWEPIDLTLEQFGLPTSQRWDEGGAVKYVKTMITNAPDQTLLDLARHLDLAPVLKSPPMPESLTKGRFRVFLSYVKSRRVFIEEIKAEMERYGLTCFVAHRDIRPTKEWQIEIEGALFSVDVMVALLTPGFNESQWTDQELGVAVGRTIPIVLLEDGLAPYGFIGKYQALQAEGWQPEKIAKETVATLATMSVVDDEFTYALVDRLEGASLTESRRILDALAKRPELPADAVERINDRISDSPQLGAVQRYDKWQQQNANRS